MDTLNFDLKAKMFRPEQSKIFNINTTYILSAFDYWFYIPIVAPHLGAIFGSILYEVLVNFHWPEIETEDQNLVKIIGIGKCQ